MRAMTDRNPGLDHLKNPVHLLALGFGAGCVPKLPGTAGTLVGVLFYVPLQHLPDLIYLGTIAVFLIIGVWVCGRAAQDLGVHDHTAIVWDEITGYLITMIMAPRGWHWILAGFVLFRVFDILKPWPVSWADRQIKGGFGIMLDDVCAAFYALLSLQLMVRLF
jgi:phosphatidylglycerophosphatase A